MKEYFTLQYKIINRTLKDYGVQPLFGYLFILVIFAGLSIYFFYITEFAQYIYILTSLALTSRLSEIKRNDFLKLCFHNKQYKLVRIIENLIVSVPFLIFLIYNRMFIGSIILVASSMIIGMGTFKTILNITIPTPFYKKPFEFVVGFRNTFFIFPIAFILMFISISVGNFNLGIFSLVLIFLVILSYYLKPENEYFVWMFAMTPKKFIFEKIKTALLFTLMISLPLVLTLAACFLNNIVSLIAFYIIGCVFLITIIAAKYSAYPKEMNLPEGIIIVISISFPPLLLVITPYFYLKAIKKLQRYLV